MDILHTLDDDIRTEEVHCDKLKLYKKGMMHDLLTGKVRVAEKEQEAEFR